LCFNPKIAWEAELASMEKFIEWIESGKDIRNGMDIWTSKDIEYLNEYRLLTAKPVMFAINLTFEDFKRKKNKFLKPIYEWVTANAPGSPMIPYSGVWESQLQDLEGEEYKAKVAEMGAESALPKIKLTAFNMINLIYFFTQGPKEVRAWVIRKGMKAPQAAGTIHTDMEKGFICAEVMAYEDLKALGSESEVKAKGKYRQEGKNYEITDGDILVIKHNAPAGKK